MSAPDAVRLVPGLSARLALASGSDRPELIPSEAVVRRALESNGRGDDDALLGWIMLACEMCRVSMEWRRKCTRALDQAERMQEYLPPMGGCPGCGDETPGGIPCRWCAQVETAR